MMEINSLANNIEDAIFRSKQIMQESKTITLKNSQRKTMLEQKFSLDDLKPEKESPINESQIIRKISDLDFCQIQEIRKPEENSLIQELQNEILLLNQKIKNQALRIQVLESNLAEVNLEKMQAYQELKLVRKEHQRELNQIIMQHEKAEDKKQVNELNGTPKIEERIALLEEKYKLQVVANHELIENIKKLQNGEMQPSQNEKINELEEKLLENTKKYKTLKERLEKTESLLLIEKCDYFSPQPCTGKKPRITQKSKIGNKTKLVKTSSGVSKLALEKLKKQKNKIIKF